MRRRRIDVRKIAKALGATRVFPVGRGHHTPIEMLGIAVQIQNLRSTGPHGTGRPTNPGATLSRLVKFKPDVWRKLHRVARTQAKKTGRRVSPGQVASLMIEQAVLRIRE